MPDRHKNKRGQRPMGTGKPDPAKDRGAHDAARGKKMLSSLKDLSNMQFLADEHIKEVTDELATQSDRGAALIAAALLDISLRQAMLCRFVHFKDFTETMYMDQGAPLGSFSARITVARAMGVIGEVAESHLNCIRRIRNQFAHSPIKVDFTHDAVASEIESLAPDNPEWMPSWTPQRRRYLGTCVLLGDKLESVIREHHTDTHQVWTG